MLIKIQKMLNGAECPSCSKTKVLEAGLYCSRDDQKCQTVCECKNCGSTFMIETDANQDIDSMDLQEKIISCNIQTKVCRIEDSFLQKKKPKSDRKRNAA